MRAGPGRDRRRLLDRIIARWHPQQVWLFGSRARGDATPESDRDLFVVVDDSAEDADLDPGVGRRLRRECGVRADVIPWRASELVEFRDTPNTLACSVAKDGVLLHERSGAAREQLRITGATRSGPLSQGGVLPCQEELRLCR